MQSQKHTRLTPDDVLMLSSTNKNNFSEVQEELSGRLRDLNICDALAIYSRCWQSASKFVPRATIPQGFPLSLDEASPGLIAPYQPILVEFSHNNVISQYSHSRSPACILLLRNPVPDVPLTHPERAMIAGIFARLYSALLATKRTEVYSGVLLYAEGGSLDRFVLNCLRQISQTLVSHESATTFLPHRRMKQYLIASAATKGLKPLDRLSPDEMRQRALVSVTDTLASPIQTGHISVFEDLERPRLPKPNDDNVIRIWNTMSLPLALQRDHVARLAAVSPDVKRRPEAPIGILRVTNFTREQNLPPEPRSITWEDVYLLEFIAEIMFVLSRVFVTADRYENEIERTIHGFRYLINGTHQNLQLIDRALTSGIPGREGPLRLVEGPGRRLFTLSNVQNWIAEAMRCVEDMDFQFEKTTKGKLKRIEVEKISTFHRDVLMIAIKNARRAAGLYDRKTVLFNRIDELGSLSLPRVTGNRSVFVSVLRNLFENSLKYAPRDVTEPHIDITFALNDREYLDIRVRDYGLGIALDERQHLFGEGFRGSAAHEMGAIGSGIGLSYSRELMRQYGGDLFYGGSPDDGPGAVFVLRMKRA